jgi:hypothetical protein
MTNPYLALSLWGLLSGLLLKMLILLHSIGWSERKEDMIKQLKNRLIHQKKIKPLTW